MEIKDSYFERYRSLHILKKKKSIRVSSWKSDIEQALINYEAGVFPFRTSQL